MEKYLKQQLITSKITSMLIKGVLSSVGAYSIINNLGYDIINTILAFMLFFNMLYMLCSLFQFCLKQTGNYIIGAVVFIVSLVLMFFSLAKIEENIGSISGLVFIIFILIFFISDIIGLVKLIRIPVE